MSNSAAVCPLTLETNKKTWLPTSIPWTTCFIDEGKLEGVTWLCANLTVPVDYRAGTGNETTTIGVAKARPIGLQNPIGAMFPNTGGPSGSYSSYQVSS